MARRSECANCGRDVRSLPDTERRFEDGRWFCSQSCFLAHESSAARNISPRKPTRPRRKWRRRLGWTLGVVMLVFAGLAALGAVVAPPEGETTETVLKID